MFRIFRVKACVFNIWYIEGNPKKKKKVQSTTVLLKM